VKSVLVVTDAPEFFSRSGSFGFDRAWSYEQIKAVPGVTDRYGPTFDAPVLRTARPLDEAAERAADPVLDELLGWATTVVRLPLLKGADARLGKRLIGPRGVPAGVPALLPPCRRGRPGGSPAAPDGPSHTDDTAGR
jgi:hypothetical protein